MGHRISIWRRGIRVELFLEESEKVVVRQLSESGGGAGKVPEGGSAVIHGLVRAVEEGEGGRVERPESYKAGRDGESGGCLGRTIKGDGLHDCLSLRPDPIRLHTPMANSVSSNRRHSPSLVGHQIAHPLKWTATCLLPCIVSVRCVLYVLQTSSSMPVHSAVKRHDAWPRILRICLCDLSLRFCRTFLHSARATRSPPVHRGINDVPTVPLIAVSGRQSSPPKVLYSKAQRDIRGNYNADND